MEWKDRRAGARTVHGLAILAALLACNPSRTLYQAGLPSVKTSFVVTQLERRGAYLDVTLRGEAATLRLFVPADQGCSAVVEPEARVSYASTGSAGRLERNERRCEAVGIGSLDERRRRRPSPGGATSSPVPREPASYRVAYEDDEVFLLRGSFPLAGLLGWTGVHDTVAVVPRTPACEEPARRGHASLQYYRAGSRVLELVASPEPCTIIGLIQPLPEGAGTAQEGGPE